MTQAGADMDRLLLSTLLKECGQEKAGRDMVSSLQGGAEEVKGASSCPSPKADGTDCLHPPTA